MEAFIRRRAVGRQSTQDGATVGLADFPNRFDTRLTTLFHDRRQVLVHEDNVKGCLGRQQHGHFSASCRLNIQFEGYVERDYRLQKEQLVGRRAFLVLVSSNKRMNMILIEHSC